VEPAPADMSMAFPMSFGKVKEEKKADPNAHKNTARPQKGLTIAAIGKKGGVAFGPRLMDSVVAAGAGRRADKTAEKEAEAARAEQARAAAVAAAEAEAANAAQRRPDADSDQEDLVDEHMSLPLSHEVIIAAHDKAVTAMSFDPKCARMVTGGMDGAVKFYDFGGMTEAKEPFRVIEPADGHMVQAISFNPTGGCLLVCCSDSIARIYDRDGSSKPIQMTVKGDMYVRDMQHTKGHTQMITGGMWNPIAKEKWITCSLDGTMRIWDINATPVGMDQVLPSVHVLKTLDRRNVCVGGAAGRAGGLHPRCCAYSAGDSSCIVGGCTDGSVQLFKEKARYLRPDTILREAHTAAVTDVAFIKRGTQSQHMVTRGMDDQMKVWDLRMLSDKKGPLKVFSDLPCGHEKAGICVSPDGRYIAAGTPFEKTAASGNAVVRVFDATSYKQVRTLDFGKRSGLRFAWPQELNQLVVGTTTGEVSMLYNPSTSRKGALHFVGRKAKVKASHELEDASQAPIFNMTDPEEIKKFYSTGHGNMQKIRRQEARQAQKTLTPIKPPSKDGAAGTSDGMAFAAMVLKAGAKQLHLNNASGQEKDSQKALLAYQEKAEKDPILIGRAYKDSQPQQLLDWSVDESEGDKRMALNMKGDFCRKCGQKVCRCVDYSVWGRDPKKPRTS